MPSHLRFSTSLSFLSAGLSKNIASTSPGVSWSLLLYSLWKYFFCSSRMIAGLSVIVESFNCSFFIHFYEWLHFSSDKKYFHYSPRFQRIIVNWRTSSSSKTNTLVRNERSKRNLCIGMRPDSFCNLARHVTGVSCTWITTPLPRWWEVPIEHCTCTRDRTWQGVVSWGIKWRIYCVKSSTWDEDVGPLTLNLCTCSSFLSETKWWK